MTTAANDCTKCNKSSLSLLLLRPSPIARAANLAPAGSQNITSDLELVRGLVPASTPTESRYVLRTLRAGYVHVYIKNPPPGMRAWMDYRITDQSDVVPDSEPLFSQPSANIQCSSNAHNAAGLRVLTIPQAHRINTIWIAFSANKWCDKLKAKNAANPDAMQRIDLAGGSPNTFKPTATQLKSKVLEAALHSNNINGSKDHDFPFHTLASMTDKLAADLTRAAACHPKTAGKELAVVLRDPVGVATEMNALRLRRMELAEQEIAKPENAHPLNSSNTLMGLKQTVLDARLAESFEKVSPLKTKAAYEASSGYPKGTVWQPLTREQRQALIKASSGDGWLSSILLAPYKSKFEHEEIGRVFYPDHEERAATWAHEQTEKTWAEFTGKYDEQARADWVKAFEAKMKAQHYDVIARYEADWVESLKDEQTLGYFKHHFDANDPNDPKKLHSPGTIYAAEVHRAYTPAPSSPGDVLDRYLALLKPSITDERSVMLRAMLANQTWAIEQIASEIDQNKRDKLYDFMKGLVLGASEAKKPNAAQQLIKKYSWLGDLVGGYSLGIWGSAVSGLTTVLSRTPGSPQAWDWLTKKVEGMGLIRQGTDLALQATLAGNGFKVPVIVKVRLPIDEAMQLLRDRTGQQLGLSRNQLKRLKKTQGTVELSLLTDSHAVAKAQGSIQDLTKSPDTTVKLGSAARAQGASALSGTIVLNAQEFTTIYRAQAPLTSSAAKALQDSLQDVRAVVKGLDGRLAIGSVVIQCLGLISNLNSLSSKDLKEVRNAWYGVCDSAAGMIGGLMEAWAVVYSSRLLATAGKAAAEQSIKLAALRISALATGVVGGIVNAVYAKTLAEDQKNKGNLGAAALYRTSAYAFYGTSGSAAGAGIGAIADIVVARQIGNATVQRAAAAVGARMAAPMLGLTLTGWGLVLLGAGMIAQVGATILTPTPLQKWVQKSYFGTEDTKDKFPSGDWNAELAGLNAALKEAQSES